MTEPTIDPIEELMKEEENLPSEEFQTQQEEKPSEAPTPSETPEEELPVPEKSQPPVPEADQKEKESDPKPKKELKETAPQSSSASKEESKSVVITLECNHDTLKTFPTLRAKVGEVITLNMDAESALKLTMVRLRRLERLIELLYHVKPSEITTPQSKELRAELDNMIKHKTI